jgi:hypothetical protein
MADTFDPYREQLIVETDTVWPAEFSNLSAADKANIETKLHAAPDKCANISYVRVHTGFCRSITVTQADIDRIAG